MVMPQGTCPECKAAIHVDEDADKGDTIECDECGAILRLVGLDPIELDLESDYDDEDEDYDDDYDDDDDDDRDRYY
jgi:alpha-aminoadipate carrier protein LysW